jgi:hypothetical protein
VTDRNGQPGQVSVYPGLPGTCERLGLTPARVPTDDELAYAARIRALDNDLTKVMDRCLTREELTTAARSSLRRHGLTGWQIQQSIGEDECAAHAIDQPRTTIHIAGR